jgi:hypothetical protein
VFARRASQWHTKWSAWRHAQRIVGKLELVHANRRGQTSIIKTRGACTLSDRCSETRHAHQNTCTCTFHVSRALSSNVRCHYFHNNLNRARFLPSRCIPTHLSLPSFVQISKYYYYSFFPHRTRGQPANRAASSQPALPHRHHA